MFSAFSAPPKRVPTYEMIVPNRLCLRFSSLAARSRFCHMEPTTQAAMKDGMPMARPSARPNVRRLSASESSSTPPAPW